MVHDDVLGELTFDPELDAWSTRLSVSTDYRHGGDIELVIGGEGTPDDRSLTRAREIVSDYARFDRVVSTFLAGRAADIPETGSVIAGLRVESINLWRGGDGMIYFECRDGEPAWRCEYISGELLDLGCDT